MNGFGASLMVFFFLNCVSQSSMMVKLHILFHGRIPGLSSFIISLLRFQLCWFCHPCKAFSVKLWHFCFHRSCNFTTSGKKLDHHM